MKDYSNYKKEVDMVNFSGNWHFQQQLKQEGSNFKLEGNSSQLIDGIEVPYRAIIRRHGQDHKEGLEERMLEFDKRFNIHKGSYVEYNDENYMIYSHVDKDNPIFNDAMMIMCNQKATWKGLNKYIPCVLNNSSYGSKGETHNIEQLSDFDARAVILIGISEDTIQNTNQIRNGMRFIFNHSKDDIYEITKKTTAYNSLDGKGYMELTCKYVKWVQEDDFENNIAFNSFLEDNVNPSVDITIVGEEYVLINNSETYAITNATNVTFSLDEDTIAEGNAEIVSQDGTSCVVKVLKTKMIQLEARDSLGKLIANPKTIYGVTKL